MIHPKITTIRYSRTPKYNSSLYHNDKTIQEMATTRSLTGAKPILRNSKLETKSCRI
ncbi:hypothetical protein FOWG_17820 [Fusarium oxysporum f. sp. lycopersici MN25]|nr:hypothetical protein FOWG_17820 [Fusarium oxysporum f. sp. lycopersici MN25]